MEARRLSHTHMLYNGYNKGVFNELWINENIRLAAAHSLAFKHMQAQKIEFDQDSFVPYGCR
jgi:hypothetical protein